MTATYRVPGATFTEREHVVPLDHGAPDGPKIKVFTREVAAVGGEDRPYLLFLQGGPGFEAARPEAPPSGWQKRALKEHRLLLLDPAGIRREGAALSEATFHQVVAAARQYIELP